MPIDPDYTAGELLDHLTGWRQTGVLYPALGEGPTFRVLNYPPLVLALMRGVAALGLSPLAAGRVVNALGLVALGAVVCVWARMRGSRGAELAGTVGLLGASFGVVYGSGQVHIELWAVALTAAGFWLLQADIASENAPVARAAVAGVLLALACFAKQSQAVPALAALLWVWRYHGRRARPATIGFIATGAFGSAAITLVWGAEPWRHMLLYTVGTYSLGNLGFQLLSHLIPWIVLICWAGLQVVRRAGSARDPLTWYWAVAALWSVAAARLGSGYPYFLDLQIATIVLVGPSVFGSRLQRPWTRLLAMQVVGVNIGVAVACAAAYGKRREVAENLTAICAQLPGSGVVLTEDAGLARACGRVPAIHPFITTSLASRGLWDAEPFEAALRSGVYSPVLLPFDPRSPDGVHRERWTAGALAAFRMAPSSASTAGGLWILRW